MNDDVYLVPKVSGAVEFSSNSFTRTAHVSRKQTYYVTHSMIMDENDHSKTLYLVMLPLTKISQLTYILCLEDIYKYFDVFAHKNPFDSITEMYEIEGLLDGAVEDARKEREALKARFKDYELKTITSKKECKE